MTLLGRRAAIGVIGGGLAAVQGLAAVPRVRSPLDFGKQADQLRIFMLMRGSLDDRIVVGCASGRYYGVVEEELTPLFGVVSATFSRYRADPAGGYRCVSVEYAYFTDPKTGEAIGPFRNPYTGETVDVPGGGYMPVEVRITPDLEVKLGQDIPGMVFDHRVTGFEARGDDVWVTELTRTSRTTPASPKPFRYSESVTLHARRSELERPGVMRVPCEVAFTNVVGWRPWLKMDGHPGHMMSVGSGRYGITPPRTAPRLVGGDQGPAPRIARQSWRGARAAMGSHRLSATASARSKPPSTSSRWRLRAGFILIPVGHSAGMNIITLLAFRFLTDNLAISAGAAGIMFALVKIYDGILDPALGAWSDRADTRWGRRLPFLFAGGLLMPIGIAAVFNVPDFGSVIAAQIFITLMLALHATAYTALTIPSMAMLVEASDDYQERTSLMAYRVFGNSLGVVLGATLPGWLLGYWGATRQGHAWMALVVAAIVLTACLLAVWLLRDAPRTSKPVEANAKQYRFTDQVRLAWRNRPFRILALAHIFVLMGTAVTSIGSAYFSKYVLLLPDSWLGSFYMIATIGSIASMPLWVAVSKKRGKKMTYILAMAAFGLLHLAWLTASPGEAEALLATRAILIGVASGGVILSAYSMLSDAVRYDYIETGLRREGAFAGITTLFDKLAAAGGIAIMGAFLNFMGYVASTSGGAAVQPPSAITAIYVCLAIVPAIAMIVSILIVLRYDLDESALIEPGTDA